MCRDQIFPGDLRGFGVADKGILGNEALFRGICEKVPFASAALCARYGGTSKRKKNLSNSVHMSMSCARELEAAEDSRSERKSRGTRDRGRRQNKEPTNAQTCQDRCAWTSFSCRHALRHLEPQCDVCTQDVKCHEKNSARVRCICPHLPVGYCGSPSTINETNCNKKREIWASNIKNMWAHFQLHSDAYQHEELGDEGQYSHPVCWTRCGGKDQWVERQRTIRHVMTCGWALLIQRHVLQHLEPCKCMCAKDECANVRENTRVRMFCSQPPSVTVDRYLWTKPTGTKKERFEQKQFVRSLPTPFGFVPPRGTWSLRPTLPSCMLINSSAGQAIFEEIFLSLLCSSLLTWMDGLFNWFSWFVV